MSYTTLYNEDTKKVSDFDIDVPSWIEQDITPNDVAGILEGGCASGTYMPAVTYHSAAATMAQHGDDVLQFIENHMGELPEIPRGESWSGIAVFFLSYAVELWASSVEEELTKAIEGSDSEDED